MGEAEIDLDLELNKFKSMQEQDGEMMRVAKAFHLLTPKVDEKKKDIEGDCLQIMDGKLKKWLMNKNQSFTSN